MKLEEIVNQNLVIDLTTLKTDEELIEQIQTKLSKLGLYPASLIDGLYGDRTETALTEFTDAGLRHIRDGFPPGRYSYHGRQMEASTQLQTTTCHPGP